NEEGIRCCRVVDQRAQHIETGVMSGRKIDGYVTDSIGCVGGSHRGSFVVPRDGIAQQIRRVRTASVIKSSGREARAVRVDTVDVVIGGERDPVVDGHSSVELY